MKQKYDVKEYGMFLWAVINGNKIDDKFYKMFWKQKRVNDVNYAWLIVYILTGQVLHNKITKKEDTKLPSKSSLSWALSMWPHVMTKSTNHDYSEEMSSFKILDYSFYGSYI